MVIKDNFDVVSGIVNKLGSSMKHVWMVCGSMWCLPGQDDSQWLDETHWPANRTPFLSSISSSGFLLVEVASDPWWQDLPNSQAACSWKGWTLVTDIELWTCTLPDLIIQTSALKLTCPRTLTLTLTLTQVKNKNSPQHTVPKKKNQNKKHRKQKQNKPKAKNNKQQTHTTKTNLDTNSSVHKQTCHVLTETP